MLHQVLSRWQVKPGRLSEGGRLNHEDRAVHSVLATAVAFKAGAISDSMHYPWHG